MLLAAPIAKLVATFGLDSLSSSSYIGVSISMSGEYAAAVSSTLNRDYLHRTLMEWATSRNTAFGCGILSSRIQWGIEWQKGNGTHHITCARYWRGGILKWVSKRRSTPLHGKPCSPSPTISSPLLMCQTTAQKICFNLHTWKQNAHVMLATQNRSCAQLLPSGTYAPVHAHKSVWCLR